MIVFAIILFFYFILIPIFSKKAILVQNSIFSLLKFIPLLFGIIAGLLVFFIVNQGKPQIPLIDSHLNIPSNKPFSLTTFSPYLGIIASIPAIFFSFDGFYNSSSIESRMKEPKQFPKAMILGILLVGVVYLTFSICLVLGTKNGTLVELTSHLGDPNIL
jgi:amino acid transporter